jgi:hypothetical protein
VLTVSIADLKDRVGQPLGESQPHTITQEQLNEFADATGDVIKVEPPGVGDTYRHFSRLSPNPDQHRHTA